MSSEKKTTTSQVSPAIAFISGAMAGGAESIITYPFEFAKTRVQLRRDLRNPQVMKYPVRIIHHVFQQEGTRAVYKGCSAMIAGSVAKDGVRFLFFDEVKNKFKDPETGAMTPVQNIMAGMCAGMVSSTLASTPAERMKIAMIDDARSKRRFSSPLQALRTIFRESGFAGLYRGYVGTTLRQSSATAFRMGTYNILKDYETQSHISQGTMVNFGNGAIAGFIATIGTQPVDVIKTRCQSVQGSGLSDAFVSILKEDGFKGFWYGTSMRLSRTVCSGGILFMVNEQVTKVLQFLCRGSIQADTLER
ncbi:hypothetical protein N7451_009147 [Penicillium sp. IBT 35674x]|nr:hypothetical protein N7451_009147 [Penicillium sp. IBT 35674x]